MDMHRKLWIVAASFLPLTALAAPSPEVKALEQQVAALQLDHALGLTQQQAQALLPLLQDAKARIQAFQAQRQAAQPALVAALNQAVADLRTNGAISDSTRSAMASAGGSRAALRDELRPLWQQARQILTADQLQALRTVRLGARPAAGAAPQNARGPRVGKGAAGSGRRMWLVRTMLSDPFVALVQARAA
jgi:hypothetical protein